MGGKPQATVWGSDLKTSVMLAALANGTAAHALDYDDTNAVMMAHPSIQLLPALFALGEYEHLTGEEVILAYVVGFEVGARLGRALNPNFVIQGWFPVGPLGVLMQTAACSKLLGLDSDQIRMALGLATNLASGLRCNNGTMAKPLMSGSAASNAILASLLPSEGMSATESALEDRFGFFENFSRGDMTRLEQAVESLGAPLEILHSGISYKLYPCCAGTHTAIDCALDIAQNYSLNVDNIEEIEVSITSGVKYLLIHPRPKTETEAKFSLEYCVARAILDGQIGLDQFTSEKIEDPALQTLIKKVKPNYGDQRSLSVEIQVRMNSGDTYSSQVTEAKGTPGNPLNWPDLEQKFQQCAKSLLSDEEVRQTLEQLKHFERLQDVAQFVATFIQTGSQ